LRILDKHNQNCSINFVNYVIEKFSFGINNIQTDNEYKFQSKFHRNIKDLGMKYRFIKVGTPELNDKVKRLHLKDKK